MANMKLQTDVLRTLEDCYLGDRTKISILRHSCYGIIFILSLI